MNGSHSKAILPHPAISPACLEAIARAVALAREIITEPGEHPAHIIATAWRVLRQHYRRTRS